MKYLSGILLALSLLLGACDKEESTSKLQQKNIPVNFSGDIPETKATKEYSAEADLTSIGVFAYFTQGNFDESTAVPNFMYNQLVEKKTDGIWSYNPVKFWPNNPSDKISFFAYAPYTNEATSGSSNLTFQEKTTASGFPTLKYTVPVAEADQIDLLAAIPLMNRNYTTSNKTVKFQLNHALVKIAIYVKSNDNSQGKVLTAFSLKGEKSGTLTYRPPVDASDKGFDWIYPATAVKETFTATAKNFAVPDSITAEKKLLATFFLMPKSTGNTFNITYTYTGSNGLETIILNDQPLPALDQWKQGAFVSYTFGIEKKVRVSVTTDTHPAWNNGSTETVDGTI